MCHTKLPMVCRHGTHAAEADRLRSEVWESIWEGMEKPESRDSFVTQIIYALQHRFEHSFSVDAIYCDMWLMVSVVSWAENEEDRITVSAECDTVEDGLAAIYKHVNETYKET